MIALDTIRVECMNRPVAIKCQIIRHIDERGNRPEPNSLEAFLQPLRARAVLHTAHIAREEERAGITLVVSKVEAHTNRAGKSARDRLDRQ